MAKFFSPGLSRSTRQSDTSFAEYLQCAIVLLFIR
jgi:hypothetical protein